MAVKQSKEEKKSRSKKKKEKGDGKAAIVKKQEDQSDPEDVKSQQQRDVSAISATSATVRGDKHMYQYRDLTDDHVKAEPLIKRKPIVPLGLKFTNVKRRVVAEDKYQPVKDKKEAKLADIKYILWDANRGAVEQNPHLVHFTEFQKEGECVLQEDMATFDQEKLTKFFENIIANHCVVGHPTRVVLTWPKIDKQTSAGKPAFGAYYFKEEMEIP